MREAFLLGLRWHLSRWLGAFDVRGRYLAPLRGKRLALLLLGYPLFLLLQLIHWLGFLIDEIAYRGYRETEIKEPLFITGIPRSGTTFVHRALSHADQFTTFRTWEALFAPSITERHLLRWLARMDNRIQSRPLHRLVECVTKRFTGDLADIHAVSLDAPEEDYLALLPMGACFIMVLAFPGSQQLWQLGRFQEMPDTERAAVLHYYRRCIQKHLYFHGTDKRFLSKNAAFGSWLPGLRRTFPDARYLVCVREPGAALSSQLSSIRPGLEFFGTLKGADTFSLELQTVLAHVYRILRDEKRSFFVDHMAIIDQSDLRSDSTGELRAALRQLCFRIDGDMEDALKKAGEQARRHPSGHKHRSLDARTGPDEFKTLVTEIYSDLLNGPYLQANDRT